MKFRKDACRGRREVREEEGNVKGERGLAEDWELFWEMITRMQKREKCSAKPSDEAGKRTSVRETEQEIEKNEPGRTGYGASGI